MQFKIEERKLSKHLEIVNRGLTSNPPLNSLKGLLIEVKQEGITIISSDGMLSIKEFIEVDKELEVVKSGIFLVSGRIFINAINKVKGYIDIKLDNNDNLNITSSDTSFRINTLNIDEYPNIDFSTSKEKITLRTKDLIDVKNEVAFAVAENDKRIVLNGINIKIKDSNIVATATNSFRLATKKIEVKSKNDVNITLLPKNFSELITTDSPVDNIDLFIDETKISVNRGNTIIQSRLIDSMYPETSMLIPSSFKSVLKIKSDILLKAIDTVTIMASTPHAPVRMTVESDKILIESKREQIGNSEFKVSEFDWEGENLSITFDSRYMKEAINSFKSEYITLNFINELKPIIIKSKDKENLTQLILPFRTY